MRAKGKRALLVLTLLCCAAFGAYLFWSSGHFDHVPPQITIAEQEITLSILDSQERLLEGVTATDARDGDVTASLVVESVRGIVADKRFTVTYAAFDHSGNVTKAQRTVYYEDYVSPRFSLSVPLIFRKTSNLNVFAPLSAQDDFDGDLTDRIKGTLVSGERQLTEEGDYAVEFRVTNSLGDTSYLTAPVRIISSASRGAELTLTEYLIYLKKGESFTSERYWGELTAGGQTISLSGSDEVELSIDSDVNTSEPGVYCVEYTAQYGFYTAQTWLLVVVEE